MELKISSPNYCDTLIVTYLLFKKRSFQLRLRVESLEQTCVHNYRKLHFEMMQCQYIYLHILKVYFCKKPVMDFCRCSLYFTIYF